MNPLVWKREHQVALACAFVLGCFFGFVFALREVETINPGTITGHASAGGGFPADVDYLNHEVAQFLDLVTQNGRKLQ